MTEYTQCSSIIRSLKTAEASEIFHPLESPLYHCPNLPSCSYGEFSPPNPQAITS